MDVFAKAMQLLDERGFSPVEATGKIRSTYSLHSLIFDVLGLSTVREVTVDDGRVFKVVEADDSTVAFWDWRILSTKVRRIYSALDDSASQFANRRINAIAWAHQSERSQAEIHSVLSIASGIQPSIDWDIVPQRRPMAKKMVNKEPIDTAIGNSMGVMVANGGSYVDLVERFSKLKLANLELLDEIDLATSGGSFDRSKRDASSLIPRMLITAYATFKADLRGRGVADYHVSHFCESVIRGFGRRDVSDENLLGGLRPWLTSKDLEMIDGSNS